MFKREFSIKPVKKYGLPAYPIIDDKGRILFIPPIDTKGSDNMKSKKHDVTASTRDTRIISVLKREAF